MLGLRKIVGNKIIPNLDASSFVFGVTKTSKKEQIQFVKANDDFTGIRFRKRVTFKTLKHTFLFLCVLLVVAILLSGILFLQGQF
ncbi:hypothetical protein QUW35_00335 [Ligilactobacillus agilis]|uniref:hypothetical protein n=1 Tax=Ligilactobacillus agilis TaxID=1601 RepID=UPI0025A39EE2|nr:hypothetical protein [Ligilactobacillus agilis]MDM8279143.1 hypothetical protein [Ligilactobacillus agilis]